MGLRIRYLRKKRGITGEQLGEMVGVSKGYISELETGKKTPGAGLVLRLADALKVEVFELYEGTLTEQKAAALHAHMEVMSQLEDADRLAIQKAALGLLAKQS
ncbi:helix-turn-helix domain-containing protein [Neotabrizicola sp. VNH66]|uniref:helix-turn-helix domain-containing protein n=1 Tax=Neotabrizicola sp. VNH66 TaxID=3400918 RepID=UPI003C0744D3